MPNAMLPCPFCGSEALRVRDNFAIECKACGAFVVSADAKGTWNTRYFSGGKNLSNESFASIAGPSPMGTDAVRLSIVRPRKKPG